MLKVGPRTRLVTMSRPSSHTGSVPILMYSFSHMEHYKGHKSSSFSGALLPGKGGHGATATHEPAAGVLRAAYCQSNTGCGLGTRWFPDEIISLRHSQRNEWCAHAVGRCLSAEASALISSPFPSLSRLGVELALQTEGTSIPESLSFLWTPPVVTPPDLSSG